MKLAELMDNCTRILADVGVRKICRHRGFSPEEAGSMSLLRRLILSDAGLAPAVASLTPAQVAVLHRLHVAPEPVGIAFFEGAFRTPEECQSRPSTFNQQYQPVFKEVQEALIRKGLVLVAEGDSYHDKTTLSRLRFGIPPGFVPFLPPVGEPQVLQQAAVETAPDGRRAHLLSLLSSAPSESPDGHGPAIAGSRLHLGTSPFTARRLDAWRDKQWLKALPVTVERSPVPLVAHLFRRVPPGQWITAEGLDVALHQHFHEERIAQASEYPFTRSHAPPVATADAICQAGWSLGTLERCSAHGKTWYRLPCPAQGDSSPQAYLAVKADGSVQVDLGVVPFEDLEHLASASRVSVAGGHLLARPNPILLGRMLGKEPAVVKWLRAHSSAYRDACEEMARRSGLQVLHENLLVARIRDKVERMRLEHALNRGSDPPRVVALGGEHIAFPRSALAEVEKFARRAGLAVRKVVP